MLGKLIAYEFRGVWKPALIILVIMAVAGVAGSMSLATVDALTDNYSYSSSDVTTDLSIVLTLFTLFAGFIVWAGVVGLFIVTVVRFYRTMFTDEGYLTLTLPVSTAALVMAKYLVGFVIMAAGTALAIILYSMMLAPLTSDYGLSASTTILAMLSGSFGFFDDQAPAAVAAGAVNAIVGIGYQLGLAYLALTMGAWLAKRHKVAAAVGIYLGISWLLSLVFSVANVLALVGIGDYGWETVTMMTGAVSVAQMVCYAVAAAACVALSVFLVRRKVDLS